MWTHDLTDHLMIELDTIIAIAIMTFIVKNILYKLHLMDERVFNDFISDKLCLGKSILAIFFMIYLVYTVYI